MLKKYLLSSFLLLCLGSLQAEIRETDEIETINQFIDENSLVLFNVTGVLYEPSNTLSSNLWREYFASRVKAVAQDEEKAQKFIDHIKNEIVTNIPKKSLESVTPQLIQDLQERHIPVLGITQKSLSTSYADNFGAITNGHLVSLGIHLEKTLDYLQIQQASEETSYNFKYGLIFTNKNPEGPALVEFFKQLETVPSKVIMVDNTHKSLENVEAALSEIAIPFEGFRYSLSDIAKQNFDPTLGTIQFFVFEVEEKVLSDEEALEIKNHHLKFDFEALLDKYIKEALN